jgi:hypothetical protein
MLPIPPRPEERCKFDISISKIASRVEAERRKEK